MATTITRIRRRRLMLPAVLSVALISALGCGPATEVGNPGPGGVGSGDATVIEDQPDADTGEQDASADDSAPVDVDPSEPSAEDNGDQVGPPPDRPPQPSKNALPDFAVADVNPNSGRFGTTVSPRDYLGRVTAWYFGHST